MKDKDLHNIQSFLRALDNAESESRRKELFEKLKQYQTDDDAFVGLRLFLEDNDWNYEEFKKAVDQSKKRAKEFKSKDNKNEIFTSKVLKYAAVFVLLTGIITLSYYFKSTTTIDDYYLNDPGLPNLMSSNDKNKWSESMQLFKEDKFNEMLNELNRLKLPDTNDTLNYYKALAHYNLNDFDKASSEFMKVNETEESVFYHDADFRKGFSLYKENKIEQSKLQFSKITSDPNHPYYLESLKILDSFFE